MFFNQTAKRWEKHPDCRCNGPIGGPTDICVCLGLRPLDEQGRPIDGHPVERLYRDVKPEPRAALALAEAPT